MLNAGCWMLDESLRVALVFWKVVLCTLYRLLSTEHILNIKEDNYHVRSDTSSRGNQEDSPRVFKGLRVRYDLLASILPDPRYSIFDIRY